MENLQLTVTIVHCSDYFPKVAVQDKRVTISKSIPQLHTGLVKREKASQHHNRCHHLAAPVKSSGITEWIR